MIANNVEFFNVMELEFVPPFSGLLLSRLPRSLRNQLNSRARLIGRNSTCAEIRFVSEAPYICLSVAALANEQSKVVPEIRVMRGNYEHSRHLLTLNTLTSIHLSAPDFSNIAPQILQSKGFSASVWRIICGSPSIVFCGLESFGYPVRSPEKKEKPAFTCLCYGSSLTNSALDGMDSWPMIMGNRLGIDVLNLGMSGSCHIEAAMAEHISTRDDWDGIILELGANILDITLEEFASRVDYILRCLFERYPSKPIVLLTMFPAGANGAFQQKSESGELFDQFNKILRDSFLLYHKRGACIYLIEGSDILDDPSCLSVDLLHPKSFGHAVMGLNMANRLHDVFK